MQERFPPVGANKARGLVHRAGGGAPFFDAAQSARPAPRRPGSAIADHLLRKHQDLLAARGCGSSPGKGWLPALACRMRRRSSCMASRHVGTAGSAGMALPACTCVGEGVAAGADPKASKGTGIALVLPWPLIVAYTAQALSGGECGFQVSVDDSAIWPIGFRVSAVSAGRRGADFFAF